MTTNKPNKPIQDGIYVVKPGQEWLAVKDGKQQTFSAPNYDLEYLTREYKGVPFWGPIDGDRESTRPSTAEMTEHLPEEFRGTLAAASLDRLIGDEADPHRYDGLFTGPLAVPGYDANGNRVNPSEQ